MKRLLLMAGLAAVTCVAAAGAVSVAPAAAAAPHGQTITETFHQHGTWTESGDTDFCTGADVSPTFTGNEVEHDTYFTNSDEFWFTFTEEGTATFTSADGLTYSGRVTVWAGGNANERNANQTFTASFRLYATDASGVVHTEVGHQVAHVAWNAVDEAPVVSFEKMFATCG